MATTEQKKKLLKAKIAFTANSGAFPRKKRLKMYFSWPVLCTKL
jgi:hypothetical protein